MPSISQNQDRWSAHEWVKEGHEWSPGGTVAGGEIFWWRSLLPRVHAFLPAGRVLEIGPGFGRWTSFLAPLAERLILVDVTERCLEHCRAKFAHLRNIAYWVNDGASLSMIEDGSLDFVFSFDSLVHADAPVLRSYLMELARKLRPGGSGFVHHSNLAALAVDGVIPGWVQRRNWRSETMSAALFRHYCREADLECRSQEVINWVSRSPRADRHRIGGPGIPLTDVLSVFTRPPVARAICTSVYVNPTFVHEWRQCTVLADTYGAGAGEAGPCTPRERVRPRRTTEGGRRLGESRARLVTRVKERLARDVDAALTLARDQAVAGRVRRHEPILNALVRGRCPDCDGRLSAADECLRCSVRFRFPRPR